MGIINREGSLYLATGIDNSGLYAGRREAMGIIKAMAGQITSFDVFSGIGISAATAFASAAKSSYDFEKEFQKNMLEVATISTQVEGSMTDFMNRVMAITQEIPIKAPEAAKALYQIVSAGHDGADGMKVLEVSARSAIGGMTDTATAADAITTLINAYKLSAADAEKVSDQLFTTARLGKTTFGELGQSIAQVAPIAASYGVEMDQVLAAVATLTKSGTPTAQAMTQIRAAIIGTSKVLGDGAFNSRTFQDALAEVANKAGGSESKLRELIPEVEAVNGVLGLTGIKAQDAAEHLKAMNDSAGATSAAFELMMNDVDKQMTLLSNNIQAALRPMGQAILKEVSEIAEAFNEAFANGDLERSLSTLKTLLELTAIAWGTYKVSVAAAMVVENLRYQSSLAHMQGLTKMQALLSVLKGKTDALTASMLKNPYALMAAAVAALGYGLYKLWTYQTQAQKNQEKLNETIIEFNAECLKEERSMNQLFDALGRVNTGTVERKKIIDTINTQYGKYLPNLLTEESSLDDINAAYKAINASLKEQIALKIRNTATDKIVTEGVQTQAGAISKMRKSLQERIKNTGIVDAMIEEIKQTTDEFQKGGSTWEKAWQQAYANVQRKYSGKIKLGNGLASSMEDYVKSVFDTESAVSLVEKQYAPFINKIHAENDKVEEALNTKTGGKTIIDGKTLAKLQKQSDLLLEISRNAKERENAERQTALEIEQTKIDIMKDGYLKEQAQLDLNHQKALLNVKQRGEEMLKAQQDAERKQWEKDGKKGVFTPATTSVSQLPIEQLQQLAGLMNGVVTKTDHDSKELFDNMIKKYQTYAEQRKEIEKKFDDEIRSMQDKNVDGKYDANIKEAEKLKNKALSDLDTSIIANKSMWSRLFADTSAMSKKQIKQILSDIKHLTDYLEGVDLTIPVGFTEEQLKSLKEDPEKIKAIYDELIKKQEELDDRTNYPLSGFTKGFDKLKESADLARKAMKATTEEEKHSLEYQAEAVKAKGMQYIADGAVEAADGVSFLADKLSELAKATGDERLSETAEQFGAIAQNFAAAGKGFQSGGWIGAIIGGATDMITQTFSAFATAKAEAKEYEDNRRDFLNEYNLLQLRNRMSAEDQDNVFGTSALKRASEAAKVAQEAMAQYTEEITKRTAPEIRKEFNSLGAAIFSGGMFGGWLGLGKKVSNESKVLMESYKKGYTDLQAMAVKTRDYSGWANFWGKKDKYTSLKDLAPQLWDKETGDFDIDAAKAFLETNTQINDEQRKQIQNVIDLKEAYDEALQVLKDDIADTFGSLGEGVLDSIVGAVQNGDIAINKFSDSVGKTFEKLGKKIMQELFFQKEFDKLQEDLLKTYDLGNSEAIANSQMDIVSRFFDTIGSKMDAAETWLEDWKKKAAEKGFSIFGEDDKDWLGTTADSITQSILNGIRGGKTGIKEFSGDFEDAMKTAVMNSIKMQYLETPMKEFYKKFANFSESGGQLTKGEIEELRGMYNDIVTGALSQFDAIKEISGLDFSDTSDNTLKGAYAKANQESIDLLAGQTGAQRVAIESIREQMQFIRDLQVQGWKDVEAIKVLVGKLKEVSDKIYDAVDEIKGHTGELSEYSERTVNAVEGTLNVKVKM